MNRRNILSLTAGSTLGLALLSGGAAIAQQKTLKDQLVGTWIFIGSTGKLADGSPVYGTNPKGQNIFEANSSYSNMLMRSDIPKYASGNRLITTPEENKTTVQGVIATYGTYTVNEADRSYTVHVEGSSFPNWNGTDQKRTVASITADELKINNPGPSISGPPTVLTYRRAK